MKSAILCIGTEITTELVKDINDHFIDFNITGVGLSPQLAMFVTDQNETITKSLHFILEAEEIK